MAIIICTTPILLLFVLMLGFKVPSQWSALITLACTVVLGIFAAPALGLLPTAPESPDAASIVWWSIAEGSLKALLPILLIILMAIYSYNIVTASGQIEVIKRQFLSITEDRGLLVLMMVWGFGGLLEGMAGFGTAVAIPAAILIGLGFKPMFSALVALLGNTVSTGFGSAGVPVTTLCNEISSAGISSEATSAEIPAMTVIQLSPLFIIIPFTILMMTDRKPWARNLVTAVWVGGVSLTVQYICAKNLGPETPAIIGSVAAIAAIISYDRLFCRKAKPAACRNKYTPAQTSRAWSVYIFILVFILLGGPLCPPVNDFLKSHLVSRFTIPVINSTFTFEWISNTGFLLFLGSLAGGLTQGLGVKRLLTILAVTLLNLRFTFLTIICLISLASVMNHTGMTAGIATGLVMLTGSMYPLFAPLVGATGTFVTGSDTSSNILFGKLQASVARQLGMTGTRSFYGFEGMEPNWLAASNTTGATGGKMISPQSIAIATAACNMKGEDDTILRKAIPYALGYIIIAGIIVYCGTL